VTLTDEANVRSHPHRFQFPPSLALCVELASRAVTARLLSLDALFQPRHLLAQSTDGFPDAQAR
jgi:hypothetical protein